MGWGELLIAIWNGPFHAGPLTRPVAVGDVLLTLFQTIWRAIVLVAMGIGALLLYIWLSTEPSLFSQLRVTVRPDKEACTDAKYPLLVTFHNESKRTVRSIDFRISAKQEGRSSDLVSGYPSYSSDYIMPPRTLRAGCWAAPTLKPEAHGQTVSYSAEITTASESAPSTY